MIVKERDRASLREAVMREAIPLRPNEMTDYDALIELVRTRDLSSSARRRTARTSFTASERK